MILPCLKRYITMLQNHVLHATGKALPVNEVELVCVLHLSRGDSHAKTLGLD